MNISENLYHSTRASLMGPAGGRQTAGSSFFSSLEDMRRELADPESGFYQDMYATMMQTVRENDERRKEEAVIDALMAAVDNMTGTAQTESGVFEARTGVELGLTQDGDPREPLTTEMLAFLAMLGGRDTFRVAEDEETEAEKVRESGAEAVEAALPEDRISALAERYDPHHMEQSEFVEFMDTLTAEGAMRPEDAEAIKNTGRWMVTVERWTLEDGNGRVIDSGTNWTPPGRMDALAADSRLMPCLYDGGEDDGDVLAWARLGVRSAYSEEFQALADILERMEAVRAEETAEI